MKVSKDQHLKAERKCLSAAATEWSVTRDQTPGANLRIQVSHIHVLLTSLGQHVPLKINVGFAKVWRKKTFFLAKMAFSTWKNLEQPSYILHLQLHIYIYIYLYLYNYIYNYIMFLSVFCIIWLQNSSTKRCQFLQVNLPIYWGSPSKPCLFRSLERWKSWKLSRSLRMC